MMSELVKSLWFIAAMSISITAMARDYVGIPFVVNESMRAYCEEQPGDYGDCMKDQHMAYVRSELHRKAAEAECATKYPVHSHDYLKCINGLTCNAEGCVRQ